MQQSISYLIVRVMRNYAGDTNSGDQELFVKLNTISVYPSTGISLIHDKKVWQQQPNAWLGWGLVCDAILDARPISETGF